MAWVFAKDFGRDVGLRYQSNYPGDPPRWSIDIDDAYKWHSLPHHRDYESLAIEVPDKRP